MFLQHDNNQKNGEPVQGMDECMMPQIMIYTYIKTGHYYNGCLKKIDIMRTLILQQKQHQR